MKLLLFAFLFRCLGRQRSRIPFRISCSESSFPRLGILQVRLICHPIRRLYGRHTSLQSSKRSCPSDVITFTSFRNILTPFGRCCSAWRTGRVRFPDEINRSER